MCGLNDWDYKSHESDQRLELGTSASRVTGAAYWHKVRTGKCFCDSSSTYT